MSNLITRRGFLSALGIGAAAIAVPALVVEPHRKVWQVGRSAPVGDHFWQSDMRGLEAWLPIEQKSEPYFGMDRRAPMRAVREKYETPRWMPKPEGAKTLAESIAGKIDTVAELHAAGLIDREEAFGLLNGLPVTKTGRLIAGPSYQMKVTV